MHSEGQTAKVARMLGRACLSLGHGVLLFLHFHCPVQVDVSLLLLYPSQPQQIEFFQNFLYRQKWSWMLMKNIAKNWQGKKMTSRKQRHLVLFSFALCFEILCLQISAWLTPTSFRSWLQFHLLNETFPAGHT